MRNNFLFFQIFISFSSQLIFSGIINAQTQDLQSDYWSLVSVERAFAKTSELIGSRDAFLTFFAPDAKVFAPEPAFVTDVYKNRSRSSSSLLWFPVFAEIAKSGDFGFTTGPWQYKKDKNDESPSAYGHYVSIWKREEIGIWKVSIDGGISYPKPEEPFEENLDFNDEGELSTNIKSIEKEGLLGLLIQVDNEFSSKSSKEGFASAFTNIASQNVRLYRNGKLPILGLSNSLLLLNDNKLEWVPIGGDVSKSGELGYSYGTGVNLIGPNIKFSYFRIWKNRGEGWELILDLMIPIESSQ